MGRMEGRTPFSLDSGPKVLTITGVVRARPARSADRQCASSVAACRVWLTCRPSPMPGVWSPHWRVRNDLLCQDVRG